LIRVKFKATLKRELVEELGVQTTYINKSGIWSFNRNKDGKKVNVQNYDCSISGAIVLSDEHQDYKWCNSEEVKALRVKDPSFFEAIK